MPDEIGRIIVTGGAGFVGSRLALALQNLYPHTPIVVIDDFSTGTFQNLKGFRGTVVTCKLGTRVALDDLYDVYESNREAQQIVFHQAAITDTTIHDEGRMMESNVESMHQLLRLCGDTESKLIYASSSAVYGQHPEKPMVEGKREKPLNIYAFSKLMADMAATQANHVQSVGLRYFNVYGPGEAHKDKAASMIYRLYRQLKGYHDADKDVYYSPSVVRPTFVKLFEGSANKRRDWVHVNTVVDANIAAIEAKPGIYNVGSGKASSFVELVKWIGDAMCLNETVKFEYFKNTAPEYYQNFTQADLSLSKTHMPGFSPIGTKAGIKHYVKWLENNE
jgi:ADP-L-glycero-D-manno-heptose 6-epimerase